VNASASRAAATDSCQPAPVVLHLTLAGWAVLELGLRLRERVWDRVAPPAIAARA
jgi:hypothetical protein